MTANIINVCHSSRYEDFFAVCRFIPEKPQLVCIFERYYNVGLYLNIERLIFDFGTELINNLCWRNFKRAY